MADTVIVEGRWAVEALIGSSFFTARRVYLQSGRHQDLRRIAESAGVIIEEITAEALSEKAGYEFHRGVFAEADRPEPREPDREFLETAKRLVIPVGLADPGNLGTIVRTAAAFGADGILIERGKGADIFSRKAIRASARAVFRVPVFECAGLAVQMDLLKKAGFVLHATGLGEDTKPLQSLRPAAKSAILFGEESDGLTREIMALCDKSIRIPMSKGMDSLNVSASAAVVLWEMFGKD